MKPHPHSIEPLEARIAPAVVINAGNPKIATYTDLDGDLVTIQVSTGAFNSTHFTTLARLLGDQLQLINLSGGGFDDAQLTVSVVKVATGDGLANIGAINSTSHDLGHVVVPGDLGQFDAGDATTSDGGVQSLTVRSMGRYGLVTQQAGGTLTSDILGGLGALRVAGDMKEASVIVTAAVDADAKIGSVTIGGSLIGGAATRSGMISAEGDIGPVKIGGELEGGTAEKAGYLTSTTGRIGDVTIGGGLRGGSAPSSGAIFTNQQIGHVKIGGDLVGGGDVRAGDIFAGGTIGNVSIAGSVFGGTAEFTGSVISDGGMGKVTVGGDVIAGTAAGSLRSGVVGSGGNVLSFTIGGSIIGGSREASGVIGGRDVGFVKIGGDVQGGAGSMSGAVLVSGTLGPVTIAGSLLGGGGVDSGIVSATGAIGPVKIGRDVLGGDGERSGRIVSSTGGIASIGIGGSLVGGDGADSGTISSALVLGPVAIARNVLGGDGATSGHIQANGKLTSLTIGGSLIGGTNTFSGQVQANGDAGPIRIGGDVVGGSGTFSGQLQFDGALGSLSIGGSLVGGTNTFAGMIQANGRNGQILITHDLRGGSAGNTGVLNLPDSTAGVTIGGSLIGGTGATSGGINAGALGPVKIGRDLLGGSISGTDSLNRSGFIVTSARIASVTIGGSIVSGVDDSTGILTYNATIRAGADLGALTVGGSLIGNRLATGGSPVVISARGQAGLPPSATSDLTIGSITIRGSVDYTRILAGYDTSLLPQNGGAQIGSVSVGRTWIASSIAAGVKNDAGTPGTADDNLQFGDANDSAIAASPIVSRIGSIKIGAVSGTAAAGDHFGFAARQIGSFKTAGYIAPLTGATNPLVELSHATGDVTLRELGAGPALPIAPGPDPAFTPLLATWTDVDGDRVTLKVSTGTLSAGLFDFLTLGPGEQLRTLDLSGGGFDGANVAVSVVRAATGDGLVNIGYLKSTAHDLGAVTIPGDLGRIDAGDTTATLPGLKSLAVRSMGIHGLATQAAGGNLNSTVTGPVGAVSVATEVRDVNFSVSGAGLLSIGRVHSITLGGSLVGGRGLSGIFQATGDIGPVKIGGDVIGHGGQAGIITSSSGKLSAATISGSLYGFSFLSGRIQSDGDLGAVKIGGNVRGGDGLSVSRTGIIESGAKMTSVSIAGSLLGASGSPSGQIISRGDITGPVSIGRDLVGGGGSLSGRISSGGTLGKVGIGNSVFGGGGGDSGSVFSTRDLAAVSIGGNLFGGSGPESGRIETGGKLGTVTIRGSFLGGAGSDSGSIASTLDLGAVRIGRDLVGGDGSASAKISPGARFLSLSIGGSLFGGDGATSGYVRSSGDFGAVTIGGNVIGGKLNVSAAIEALTTLGPVKIAGSLLGGPGGSSGSIKSNDSMGPVQIGGDLRGGVGLNSGLVATILNDRIAALSIGGSLLGGAGGLSGAVVAADGIGPMTIGRNLVGGDGGSSGNILNGRDFTSLTVGGSVVGGAGSQAGGITSTSDMGPLKIGRDLRGGSISGSDATLTRSGFIEADRIASISIGGSIVSGIDTSTVGALTANGSIRVNDDIGAIVIKGSLIGHSTPNGLSPVILTARGQETVVPGAVSDLAIRSLSIAGRVEHAQILAGYNTALTSVNGNASIGAVTVGRDWIASDLVAGAQDNATTALDDPFGDADDQPGPLSALIARIASITIRGVVLGTATAGDHFGFVSEQIGSFKSLNFTVPLTAATNVLELALTTGDVTVREP